METRGKDEMAFEQRSGVTKLFKDGVVG